jgi:hypothetical protein
MQEPTQITRFTSVFLEKQQKTSRKESSKEGSLLFQALRSTETHAKHPKKFFQKYAYYFIIKA